ncbi:MAG: ATP-binding protein [Mariprofundaceae bacterium]
MTSLWLITITIILLLWWLHVQRIKEKLQRKNDDIRQILSSQDHLESKLARRDHRLDVLFSAVNEVVFRVDRLGRVITANRQARDAFNMDDPLPLPQSMIVFYRNPEWHSAFSAALAALPSAATLPDIHIGNTSFAPRLAPLGKGQAMLLCVDISERIHIEMQRKALFSNLMHDLKTPLTSLLGYARSIKTFADDPQLLNEAAETIANEATHINSLLDALLTLEHLDATHSGEVKEAHCDQVEKVMTQIVQEVQPLLHKHASTLHYHIPDEKIPSLQIGQTDLYRILTNLLENAIQHTPNHCEVTLLITNNHGTCTIEVCDQGLGISEQHITRVTERFYRIDKARKRGEGGHGLGLAIVKELVERHGGSLSLKNNVNGGLCARIQLKEESSYSAHP